MTEIIIPEEITLPLFVCLSLADYNFNKILLSAFDPREYSSNSDERILLVETEITVKLPQDIDVKGRLLGSLEKKKSGIQAEYHMRLKEVQDKIDNLLAIEHQGEQ